MKKIILLTILISIIIVSGCRQDLTITDTGSQIPDPASVYCKEQGGILEIRTNTESSQIGYCIFPNGSECEEWSYFCGCTKDKRYCGMEYPKCDYECK